MPSLAFLRSCLAAFASLACLATAGVAAAQSPSSPTSIRFSLDSRLEAPAAPFLVAVDKGYFKAEGLDVSIDPLIGSSDPIGRVASGSYDMGVADLNALIRFRDQQSNAPKAVFAIYNRAPFAVIARKSRGIVAPRDLEGKKLGAPATDGALTALKIFTQLNGVDLAKVTVENVGIPVREPMLAAGQVDAIAASAFSSYVDLKDRGVPVDDLVVLLMADYGLKLYGNAVIVNPKFAAEKPAAVRAFLRALLRALKDTVNDPAGAIESVARRSEVKKDFEVERLRLAIKENILTGEVRANGYGAVDMQRLAAAIDQLGLVYEFKSKPKPGDVFTPDFLPSEADRLSD